MWCILGLYEKNMTRGKIFSYIEKKAGLKGRNGVILGLCKIFSLLGKENRESLGLREIFFCIGKKIVLRERKKCKFLQNFPYKKEKYA